MADVRLTATNPENSEAVPVACNAKGELLLEAPEAADPAVLLDDGGTKQVIKSAGLGISDGSTENITLEPGGSATFADKITAKQAFLDIEVPTAGVFHVHTPGEEGFSTVIQGNGNMYTLGGVNCGTVGNPGECRLGVSAPTAKARLAIQDATVNSWWGVANQLDYFAVQRWDGATWGTYTSIGSGGQFLHNGTGTFTSDVIIGSRGQQWMIVESNGLAHLVAQTFRDRIKDKRQPRETEYPELRNIPGELTMIEEQLQKVMEFLRMVPEAGWEVWDGSD